MSKPVRIKEHLYGTIEEMARAENRSITNMIEVLLAEAIAAQDEPVTKVIEAGPAVAQVSTTRRAERASLRASADDHFKPDPK